MNWLLEFSSEGYASEAFGEMPRSCEFGSGYCAARDGRDNLAELLEHGASGEHFLTAAYGLHLNLFGALKLDPRDVRSSSSV
jgi:hypothetical protein